MGMSTESAGLFFRIWAFLKNCSLQNIGRSWRRIVVSRILTFLEKCRIFRMWGFLKSRVSRVLGEQQMPPEYGRSWRRLVDVSRMWAFLEISRCLQNMDVLGGDQQMRLGGTQQRTFFFDGVEMENVEGGFFRRGLRRGGLILNLAYINTNASVHQDNTMYPQLWIAYIKQDKVSKPEPKILEPKILEPIPQNKKVP